jgi:two-component system nitrate/nitrite response regulator NarL
MADHLRVAIIDDHPLFREGVVHTLRSSRVLEVVGEGGCADDAVRIAKEKLPDIVLLDVSMPGGGIEAARSIARLCPVVKTIMLTVSESELDVAQALEAGVKGYVLKGTSGSELLKTMFAIARGESYVTPGLAARLLSQATRQEPAHTPALPELTDRESQILSHVARGLTNKEIARTLTLSEKTVKHYMTNIMQKLNVRNRVEAVLVFRKEAGAPSRDNQRPDGPQRGAAPPADGSRIVHAGALRPPCRLKRNGVS